MKPFLSKAERKTLMAFAKKCREQDNTRAREEALAVLDVNRERPIMDVASSFMVTPETVSAWVRKYINGRDQGLGPDDIFGPDSGGDRRQQLNPTQTIALKQWIEDVLPSSAKQVARHVKLTWNVSYTISGMTAWLLRESYTFRKPSVAPGKLPDEHTQQQSAQGLNQLCEKSAQSQGKSLVFCLDACHPTTQTKPGYAWVKQGVTVTLPTTARSGRVNILGAIDPVFHHQVIRTFQPKKAYINGADVASLMREIRRRHPDKQLTLVLDNGSMNRSNCVKQAALDAEITLHFLPAYSPHHNPIERLWKLANEHVRNNHVFSDAQDLCQSLRRFYQAWCKTKTGKEILARRITPTFPILSPATHPGF